MYEAAKVKIEEWVNTNSLETIEAVKSNFESYLQCGFMSLIPMSTTTLFIIIAEPNQSVEERKYLSQLVIDVLKARFANA
jgi:hypothetical protein